MNTPPLIVRNLKQKTLERGHWWTLPFEPIGEKAGCRNPDLKIAGIVSERLGRTLPYESNLLLLTPENWNHIIRFARPDFVLVESCFQTCTGHWGYAQVVQNELAQILIDILNLAKKTGIPTVFWQTLGAEYHDLFYGFARNFDFVFCADPKSIQAFDKKNIPASILLPAVQPQIHHPYREYDRYGDFDFSILFDGWGDLHRLGSETPPVLNQLAERGLSIFDSRHELWKKKIQDLGSLSNCVQGCVDYPTLLFVQRYAKVGVTFDASTFTPTSQLWWSLDALSCGMAVVHNGELDSRDIFSGFVDAHASKERFLEKIDFLLKSEFQRRRRGAIALFDLYKHHTFEHRLSTICSQAGVHRQDHLPPLVSAYTIASGTDSIEKIIHNYRTQTHSNKELVIVVPRNRGASCEKITALVSKQTSLKSIKICPDQENLHLLQVMTLNASGNYCIRFCSDTDDPEYLENMVCSADACQADFFGMLPAVSFSNSINKEKNLVSNCRMSFKNLSDHVETYHPMLLSGKKEAFQAVLAKNNLFTSTGAANHSFCTFEHANICSMEDTEYDQLLRDNGSCHVSDPIIAGLATIPSRVDSLPDVLDSIVDQFDHVYVYLNGHETVPKCLDHDKISYEWSRDHGDMGANGKFFFVEQARDGYYFSLDDDFLYPQDYVHKMLTALKKYKDRIPVCVHGSIFGEPLEWYFERLQSYSAKMALDSDQFITLPGSGTLAFHTQCMKFCLDDFLPRVMCDIKFSIVAREQGLPIVSIARPANWLVSVKQNENDVDYWSNMLVDDKGRTREARKYNWDFFTYGKIVIEKFDEIFPGISDQELSINGFDTNFITSVRQKKRADNWNVKNSTLFYRRKYQFLNKQKKIYEYSLLHNEIPLNHELFDSDKLKYIFDIDTANLGEKITNLRQEIKILVQKLHEKGIPIKDECRIPGE